MNHVLAIARVTYREAVRNRVLYSLLFFVVVLLLVSGILDSMTTGQNGRVVLDLGLAGVQLFGALIAMFLGVSAMSREVARKTLYVVLAKPVGRTGFLLGKFLGLLATLGVLLAAMGGCLLLVAAVFGAAPSGQALLALAMMWLELGLIGAVALLFAVFTGPFLSGMFTLGVFCIGHLTPGLKALGRESGDAFIVALTQGVYYLFPNLDVFDFKTEALYRLPVSASGVGLALVYGVAYTGALLALAALLFKRRDFR